MEADIELAELTVVIPARNAAAMLPQCLESVVGQGAARIIVVDGNSTDSTTEIARSFGAKVISDSGQGLPVARMLGAEVAQTRYLALVDSDVILPSGSLRRLLTEFSDGRYSGLQAGLRSEGGRDYWSRALAQHHRWGRSKAWFGLVATIIERRTLLDVGFDAGFLSGEDIEFRWRMIAQGYRLGVSKTTVVAHRFIDGGFAMAQAQFDMDGCGLASMILKNRWRAGPLLLLPAAAAARGIMISVVRLQPQWLPYYVCFCLGNYAAMCKQLIHHAKVSR